MPGEFLPPVITVLEMNIDDVIRKVEEAKALIKSIGDVKVPVSFDLNNNSLATALAKAKAAANAAGGLTLPVGFDVNTASGAKLLGLAAINREARLSAAAIKATAAAATAARGPIAGWFATWGNVIHWVVTLGAEILAVGIPALVAMGAAYLVASEGIQNVRDHMSSLNTTASATSGMFNITAGDALGMGHALQTAQTAANPHVYELLGAGLNAAKGHMGGFISQGSKMIGVMDAFGAKLDMEINGPMGKSLNGFFANGVQDATMFGQAFGNLGHSVANFAIQMPGLAEVLLHILDFLTKGASDITTFAGKMSFGGFSVLTAAMAFEEFNRWGSLVVSLMGRMGLATSAVTGGFFSLTRAGGVLSNLFNAIPAGASKATLGLATLVDRMSFLGGAEHKAADGMAAFSEKIGSVIGAVGPAQIALGALAVGGILLLIRYFGGAKNSVQDFVNTLQSATAKANSIQIGDQLGANLAQLGPKYQAASKAVAEYGSASYIAAHGTTAAESSYQQARIAMAGYGLAIQQTEGQIHGVGQNAAAIMKQFGVSYPQALAIAAGANINLGTSTVRFGHSLTQTAQQVQNYMTSMRAMGATTTAFGNDLNAMDIQTQLASSKVGQLNQALDQMATYVTSGTSGFSQLDTALAGMSKSSQAGSASITGSISTISRAATSNTYTLKGWSANAQQSWQQFDSVVSGSGQQLADWFRTAGAMGVMSSGQFTTGMKAMIGQMLPFTQHNKTAVSELSLLAQEAGFKATTSFKTLAGQVGMTGNKTKILQGIIDSVTQKMSNMSTVAQNLGGVLSSQIDSALASSIIKQSGLNQAIALYASRLDTLGPKNQKTIDALHALQAKYNDVMKAGSQAAKQTSNFGNAQITAAGKVNTLTGSARTLSKVLYSIPNIHRTVTITTDNFVNTAAGAAAGALLHPKPHAAGTSGAAPGWSVVGENGPELKYFQGGEHVVPNGISKRYTGGSNPLGSPGGGGGDTQHIHVHVDGHELFNWMQSKTYGYNVNNGTRGSGGSVRGTLAPR